MKNFCVNNFTIIMKMALTCVKTVTCSPIPGKGCSSPTWKSIYTSLCENVENSLLKHTLKTPVSCDTKVCESNCIFTCL